MPEAILRFNLPEEQDDFEMATNGPKYNVVLVEMDEHMRRRLKHESDKLSKMSGIEAYEELRQMLNEEMRERNLSLY